MFKNVPIITALVTPFTTEDEVDYPALDALIERMLGEGVTGFLVAGTTGESPNLTHAEKIALFTHVGELLKGKNAVQVANVGTNSTAASAALAKELVPSPASTPCLRSHLTTTSQARRG
ncbi:dihydrodipicolinate synthase family protein [Lacticaseibacillus sharpeae]|uniref:dihydrodipicolinate synthase family protein n=1 Tax=Lacticaseibacillus sharpeae TaxID=1626 RepID=UPI000AECA372